MGKRLQTKRVFLLVALLALAFTGLGYRLVDLQVMRHEELLGKAQRSTPIPLRSHRGDILDARGNLLATSISVKTICAAPSLMAGHQAEVARVIAPLLKMSEAAVYQQLFPRLLKNSKGETVTNGLHYVRLQKNVSEETWQQIKSVMTNRTLLTFGVDEKKLPKSKQTFYNNLRKSAIFAEAGQLRVYPNGALAAHVLGFASSEELKVGERFITQINGRDGIEKTLNTALSDVAGWYVTETDRRGSEMVPLRGQEAEARDGLNVVLTIDSVVQHTLESALTNAMEKYGPISASGVVIRPRTGEILAMATLPNFDPNNLNAASTNAMRNRIITDVMEPGSTFKIVAVSGALNERRVTLNDTFDCEHGAFAFAGRVLHDHEAFGTLSVRDIIVKSSNIGAAKVGIQLGADKLYDYIHDFGFGERTGISLPGERDTENYVHPVKDWSKVSIAQIPMGQGIAVTRLQMAFAMCAIANNGWLMRPMLVDRLEDRDHNVVAKYSPQRVRQVISESTATQMVEALKGVVVAGGTAVKAGLTNYTVAGKTGTAQKVEGGVYVHGKYIASFIGFFPADNPEVCIAIVLDEPSQNGYYGGLTAGPTFKQVAERVANYLNIRPDIDNGQPGKPPTAIAGATDNARPLKTIYARTITKP